MAEVGKMKTRWYGRKFQKSEKYIVTSHPRADQKKRLCVHSEHIHFYPGADLKCGVRGHCSVYASLALLGGVA